MSSRHERSSRCFVMGGFLTSLRSVRLGPRWKSSSRDKVGTICGRRRRPKITAHPNLGTNRFHFDGAGNLKSVCLICFEQIPDVDVFTHMINEHECVCRLHAEESILTLEEKRAQVRLTLKETYSLSFFLKSMTYWTLFTEFSKVPEMFQETTWRHHCGRWIGPSFTELRGRQKLQIQRRSISQ